VCHSAASLKERFRRGQFIHDFSEGAKVDDVIVEATETSFFKGGWLDGAVRSPDGVYEILKMSMYSYSLGSEVGYLMKNPQVSESFHVKITIRNPGVKEYVLDTWGATEAKVTFQSRRMVLPANASNGTLKVTKFQNGGRVVTGHIRAGANGYDLDAKFEVVLL
jgi:hypothetical protein